jgi:excisionase family DNA binding protein
MREDAMRETADHEPQIPDAERHVGADSALAIGDELLTVHDAAHFLKVSVSWIYEHTRDDAQDRLPFVKLGKYLRFDRADLRAYIDAKRAASRRQPRRR